MISVFLVCDYDESLIVLGAFTNRYRADKARRKRADWRKLRIVEVPLDRELPEIDIDEVRVNSSHAADRIIRLVTEHPERIVSRSDCTIDLPEDAVLRESVGMTNDSLGFLFQCPSEGCLATVEWYDDCTATWCERCQWSGWGLELRYGLPGSLTGVL